VSYTEFEIAFWHPFGPHAGEPTDKIIERKRAEIQKNGWTLWSFQLRLMLSDWHVELSAAERNEVFVFCSKGSGAVDPGEPTQCRSYRFVGEQEWRPVPDGVRVSYPFRQGKKLASAFVVQKVLCPEPFQRPAVEWFSPTKGPWCQSRVPTRGEYLIRPGGTIAMRPVSVVLVLKPPYIASLSADIAGGVLGLAAIKSEETI
jgi:hypothetical protein